MNKKNASPKNRSLLLGFISFILLTISFSCEEDSNSLGSDLLPDGDKIEILYDTTFTFKCNVFKQDSIITSGGKIYNIGALDDPFFGKYKESLAAEIVYDQKVRNEGIHVDSLILYVQTDSIAYGNSSSTISFDVFELSSKIDSGGHYSNENIEDLYSQVNKINTATEIRGDSIIAFKLSNSFADKLKADTNYYNTVADFKTQFKGIAIVPTEITDKGNVFKINLSSNNTKMKLFYRDSASDTTKKTITYSLNKGLRFTEQNYDYQSYPANDYLTNPESENDNFLLIQGKSGLLSHITFTDLDSWLNENVEYSVIKAELITSVFKDDNFSPFAPPDRLGLHYKSDDVYPLIDDYRYAESRFGGHYNEDKLLYNFNITTHFSNIVNKKLENKRVIFTTVDRFTTPSRVILKANDEIKIKVTYTKH
ncbi:MAG: DUF4270 domain-containing protein [Bacteroidales bacterium]|nr:DUF4270 domain-containing protein [Bacteroidales bacterium]